MPRASRYTDVRATAAHLFRTHGYAATTMDLIADEVGLNKGTLYHYYEGKSAILYDLMSEQVDVTLELLDEVPEDLSPRDRLHELIRLQALHVADSDDELIVFFQEMRWISQNLTPEQAQSLRERFSRYENFMRKLLTRSAKAGEVVKSDTSTVIYSIVGMLGYIPNWFHGTTPQAKKKMAVQVADLAMRGLDVR
ncbi:TetR/AcrR family transcriptional regulator [Nakamurella lactea]|uniref:TetR/AcrR family transcriptional regulator n=1 Tax=Nakamurella lactea TaxID=459515 RepID=UPI001376ED8D|nr:TetR/AcrR family transcriptional regulator [Nakamurella lactea]